jgi:hypothetical protein
MSKRKKLAHHMTDEEALRLLFSAEARRTAKREAERTRKTQSNGATTADSTLREAPRLGRDASFGAYGFRIAGLERADRYLPAVPTDWPRLDLELVRGVAEEPQRAGTVRVWEDRAELWLPSGDRIELFREPLTMRVVTRTPVATEALVHPYLGLPAAIASQWLGRLTFHGGAFVHAGRAWALLGGRETGKSATLGALMRSGQQILSDDVLIVDGTRLFAGPRTIDLRSEASRTLGGEKLGLIGTRTRWRLRPASAAHEMPIGGFVLLEWGERTTVAPLDARARLQALTENHVLRPRASSPPVFLELLALPAFRFVRPPEIGKLDTQLAQLLAAINP